MTNKIRENHLYTITNLIDLSRRYISQVTVFSHTHCILCYLSTLIILQYLDYQLIVDRMPP